MMLIEVDYDNIGSIKGLSATTSNKDFIILPTEMKFKGSLTIISDRILNSDTETLGDLYTGKSLLPVTYILGNSND